MSSVPTNSAASSSARFLSSNHEGVLELTVKIAGLVVVVLPVVGVAIRFIAFAVGGVPNAIDMATRESVAGLASTAIQAVGAGVVTVAVLAFLAYRGFFVPMPPPGKYSPRRWVQARPWLRYVVYLV